MFESFFRQLIQSFGVVFRTMRAFFMRFLTSIGARIRSMTSVTRYASQIGPKVLDAAASTGKKPAKKEDYIETGSLLISKSLIITVLLVIIVGTIFMITIGWPFIVSTFLTKHIWNEDPKVKNYSGKVIVYYDEKKKMPEFKGRLKEGKKIKEGTEYDKNNRVVFHGHYEDNVYSGYGEESVDGIVVYKGNFANGKYEGEGVQNDTNGLLKYEGTFSNGEYEGTGKVYELGDLVYEGELSKGLYEGKGKLYDDGVLVYSGTFSAGEYDGFGKLYEDGDVVYDGSFSAGVKSGRGVAYKKSHMIYKGDFEEDTYNGTGVAYNDSGILVYKGGFVDGLYSGSGSLTLKNGEVIKGEFEAGKIIGDAKCFKDDKLFYEGSLQDTLPDGSGKLYSSGNLVYEGPVNGGTIDGAALLGMSYEDIQSAFQNSGRRYLYDNSFALQLPKIGVTVVFSLATDDEDPMVTDVFIYDPQSSTDLDLMEWKTPEEYEKAVSDEIEGGQTSRKVKVQQDALYIKEIPAKYSTADYYVPFVSDDSILRFWYEDTTNEVVFYQWTSNTGDSLLANDEENGNGAEKRVEAVLAKIGIDIDDDASGSGDAGAASGGADAGGAGAAAAGGADAGGAGAAAAGGADAGGAGAAAAGGADAGAVNTVIASSGSDAASTASADAGSGKKSDSSAAKASVPQNPYYGTEKVDDLISKATPKDRHKVLKKLISYYKAAENASANAEQTEKVQESLEKAISANSMGDDSYDRIRDLKKTERKLKLNTVKEETDMSQIFNEVNGLTYGGNASGADLSSLAVYFDASTVDKEELAKAGLNAALKKTAEQQAADMERYQKNAQETIENFKKLAEEKGYHIFDDISDDDDYDYDDGEEVADGEDDIQWAYSDDALGFAEEQSDRLLYMLIQSMKTMQEEGQPVPGEIDEHGLYRLLQDELIQLQLAGLNIQDAIDDYKDAKKHAERVEKKHSLGDAEEKDVTDAKVDVVNTVTALNNNIISFAEVAADLNEMTDGYIARTYDWHADCFPDEETLAALAQEEAAAAAETAVAQ